MLSLLKKLKQEELSVWVEEGGLELGYGEKEPSDAIINELRQNKDALVSYLEAENICTQDDFFQFPLLNQTPLSFAQERMRIVERLQEGMAAYHIPYMVELKPDCQLETLELAINKLASRQKVLKTVFPSDDEGNAYQKFQDVELIIPAAIELRDSELNEQVTSDIAIRFNLEQDVPFRIHHYKVKNTGAGGTSYLLFIWHHIAFDGWSMDVFFRELESFYVSTLKGVDAGLPDLEIQYTDYANWQRDYLQGEQLEKHLGYWKNTLEGYESLNLQCDKPRPKNFDPRGQDYFFDIPLDLSHQLRALAKEEETTLYTVMLAAFYVTLSAYTGQEDIVIGTPSDNRHHGQTQSLVGFFVNSVVLRHQLEASKSVTATIADIHKLNSDSKRHQDLPFEKIVEAMNIERDSSRHPIFQVAFSLQSFGAGAEVAQTDLPFSPASSDNSLYTPAKFDLSLFVNDAGDAIQGGVNFATSLFNQKTVVSIASTYQQVLSEFVANKHQSVSDLVLVRQEEHKKLEYWNSTQSNFPERETLHSLFEVQVARTPENTALIYKEESLTYQQLNDKANGLANCILAKFQELDQIVSPDTVIGLYLDRGVDMIVAMLGVLKAGGAFAPVATDYPLERSKYILQDTNTQLVVTQGKYQDNILPLMNSGITLAVDEIELEKPDSQEIESTVESSSLAYVIYTSGTSGKPKGVMVEHRNAVNLVYAQTDVFQAKNCNRALQFASYVFDASVSEIFVSLLNGHELYIASQEQRQSPEKLSQLIQKNKVELATIPPVVLAQLDAKDLTALKVLITAGESPSLEVMERFSKERVMINAYGPTETTVCACAHYYSSGDRANNIGKPIQNAQLYVLDSHRNKLPIGAVGELYVGGKGVARGYLNRPELTGERFIQNPFSQNTSSTQQGDYLYKTGDLVRWTQEGDLEYLGRNDFQVKIRGYRIELGEIEQVLLDFPEVSQCAVVDVEYLGEKVLAAYVVLESTFNITSETLLERVGSNVPEYMVPSNLQFLSSLPQTINGKLNRSALPKLEFSGGEAYCAPRNKLEEEIGELWRQVLKQEKIGVHDNFFRLSGNSLSAVRLCSLCSNKLGIEVSLQAFFEFPTVAGLAKYISESNGLTESIVIPALGQEQSPVSFSQERLLFLERFEQGTDAYHIPYFVQLNNGDASIIEKAINLVANRHKVLKSVYGSNTAGDYQKVENRDIEISVKTLAGKSDLLELVKQDISTPFELENEVPFRVTQYCVGDETYMLLLWHHIAFDGWSLNVFLTELAEIYKAQTEGKDAELLDLGIAYSDYASWQREFLSGENLHRLENYWKANLAGFEPLNLPTDYSRPGNADYTGREIDFDLPEILTERLRQVARDEGTSLTTVMLSAYYLTLSYLSGQRDIVIGSPTDNRAQGQVQSLIGFFVNSMVLRAQVDSSISLKQFIRQIHNIANEAKAHQELPFEKLVDILGVERDLSRHPVFQVSFSFQSFNEELKVQDAKLECLPFRPSAEFSDSEAYSPAKYDLSLYVIDDGATLKGGFNYATSLFEQSTVERFIAVYQMALSAISSIGDGSDCSIAELNLLPETEKYLLTERNSKSAFTLDNEKNAEALELKSKNLLQQFYYQLARNPDQAALVFDDGEGNLERLTYEELDKKSDALAVKIVSYCGNDGSGFVARDTRVALYFDRSLEMLVSMLSVLKAGAAYVPISPEYPKDRTQFILQDSGSQLLLTQTIYSQRLTSWIEENERLEKPLLDVSKFLCNFDLVTRDVGYETFDDSRLAYVIYTSGTTGKPKGVMLEHRNVSNYTYCLKTCMGDAFGKVDFSSNYCFDLSVTTTLCPLLIGGTIYIYGGEIGDSRAFQQYLIRHNIDLVKTTPSLARALLSEQQVSGEDLKIHTLLLGGEALTRETIDLLAPITKVIADEYGPTEATVGAMFSKVYSEENQEPLNSGIGKAYPNVQLYILNDEVQPVPTGVIGELYIGGEGVARAYLNRPELTEERFIANPFSVSKNTRDRLYKTGDLVRWLPNGDMEYLGRNDFQVKIRGFRVELNEIENAISSQEGVEQSVVLLCNQEQREFLTAYVIQEENSSKENDELSEYLDKILSETLPQYMVPDVFITLDEFPLTGNGKLDRDALPKPEIKANVGALAPRTELETTLCKLWQTLLSLDEVSIEDNFFRIGGDSILSIQLVSRLRNSGFQIQVKDVFKAPTIAQLAKLINESNNAIVINAEQGVLKGDFDLLPVQQWFFDQDWQVPNHYNQAFLVKVPGQYSEHRITSALEQLVTHHDILRASFTPSSSDKKGVYKGASDFQLAPLKTLDVANLTQTQMSQELTSWQSKFDIQKDYLWQAGVISGYPDGSSSVFLAFHHLIIDTVSWTILAEDLQCLLEEKKLSRKTSSYRQWGNELKRYAEQAESQIPFWKKQLQSGWDIFEEESEQPCDPFKEQCKTVIFTSETTEALLNRANLGYNTEINDLLLSALALAVEKTFGHRKCAITLEGHGREHLNDNIDVSRTVGWFTTMYPLCLESKATIEETLIHTKESLRALPDKGIGFGALASVGKLDNASLPGMCFNYLGRMDNPHSAGDNSRGIIAGETGEQISSNNKNYYAVNINGGIYEGKLQFLFSAYLSEQKTETLATHFENALNNIIQQACTIAEGGGAKTPSDYAVEGLTLGQLRSLEAQYDIEALYPANSLQQGFVYHHLTHPQDDAYRVQVMLDYHQPLNLEAYIEAWRLASLRYPVLRTAFNWDDSVIQVVCSGASINEKHFVITDVSEKSEKEREAEILRIQVQDRKKPFDLAQPGLIRFHLIKLEDDHYTLIKMEHHAIGDGWSGPILLQTVHSYYEELVQGNTPNIDKETAYLEAQEYHLKHRESTEAYWQNEKAQWQSANDISFMLSRKVDLSEATQVQEPLEQSLVLQGKGYDALKQLCREQGITVNVAMQFTWHKLIQTYTQDEQTIVGTTVSGRDIPVEGVESSVGLYINTLPLVVNWEENKTSLEVLQDIQKSIASLNSHSGIALSKLQNDGERLFHSLFVFENYPMPAPTEERKDSRQISDNVSFRGAIEKGDYPLALMAYEQSAIVNDQGELEWHEMHQSLVVKLNYNGEWLTETQAIRLLGQLENILLSLCEVSDECHHNISLVDKAERQTLLQDWNDTCQEFPQDLTLQSLFDSQVERVPENIALIFEGKTLTYSQLNLKANRLAHCIRKQLPDMQPDTLIGLYFERSAEMVVAILAVLKAGGAYVPVSPDYPQQRTQYIFEDTKTSLVITQDHLRNRLQDLALNAFIISFSDENSIEAPKGNPAVINTASDLAYVIYTSGTSGNPKGVMIEHRSVVNLIYGQTRTLDFKEDEVTISLASYVFDASVETLFLPLMNGACLLIPTEEELQSPDQVSDLIENNKITHLLAAASYLQTLPKPDKHSIRRVITGGEACSEELCQRWQGLLVNEYGPTEACVTAVQNKEFYHEGDVSLIGKPIDNTQVYVLSKGLQPQPVGAPGELYIGGAGLARAYLNNPELTKQSFIPNPFFINDKKTSERLYKTGDLVRWLPSGYLQYLGRNDAQVKIRGFRIELGEIENALTSCTAVQQSAVLVNEDSGRKQLVAYLVKEKGAELKRDMLNANLEEKLPEYMIPSHFVFIDEMPVTTNGKLDYKALSSIPVGKIKNDTYQAPTTELEAQLCKIWLDVLGIDVLGVKDNFFRVGGDSILCIQLVSRLRREGFAVQVKDIYNAPTVAQFARYSQLTESKSTNAEKGELTGKFSLLPIQQWFFDQQYAKPNHWNQAFMIQVPKDIQQKDLELALVELAKHHDILRCRYVKSDEEITQEYLPVSESTMVPLQYLDASTLTAEDVSQVLSQWQSQFNIFDGPLWQVGLITGYKNDNARLFFAFHHLICDAVSWRIISEDIVEFVNGNAKSSEELEATSSYRQWVNYLKGYEKIYPGEKAYWKKATKEIKQLKITGAQSFSRIELSEEHSRNLLSVAGKAYSTEVNDLLLSAYAIALEKTFGEVANHITLEGHGRETANTDLDISRTLGWFTSMYPVRLKSYGDIGDTIIYTKENLRGIPNKGLGFGALVQAGRLDDIALPKIGFNYLGQFENVSETDGKNHWKIVNEDCGQQIAQENTFDLVLNANGSFHNGILQFGISSQLESNLTTDFVMHFEQALEDVVNHCVQILDKNTRVKTPSDYAIEGLTLEHLRSLEAQYDIEALYPANSLQQGFVYHHLTHPQDDAYRVQVMLDYHQPLNINAYIEAWRLASLRYPVLRTAFNWDESVIQVVCSEASIDEKHFTVTDLSNKPGDQEEAEVQRIQVRDRQKPFDLSQPGLIRFNLIKQADDHYTLIKMEHHAIGDGWSGPILLQTVHSYYEELVQGNTPNIDKETAYLEAQEYHLKHRESTEAYWQNEKAQWQSANDISFMLSQKVDLSEATQVQEPLEQSLVLQGKGYDALKQLCREQGITVNVAMQFAWHKLIETYTQDEQTIVGTTVSGRDIPVEGVESSVGLYINTLPLVVNWEENKTSLEVLQNIQKSIASLNSHSGIALSKLQNDGERLFHSLFVFENYPMPAPTEEGKDSRQISDNVSFRGAIEKGDYPLALMAYEQSAIVNDQGELEWHEMHQSLVVKLNYSGEWLTETQAQRLLNQLKLTLCSIGEALNKKHSYISLINTEEKNKVLHKWNQTQADYPSRETLHSLYEAQVERTPDAVALVFEGEILTYQQLNNKANVLAHCIRNSFQETGQPIQPDTIIGLYLERGLDMIVAILAVLKAGGTYVPIATDYPHERSRYILEDTDSQLVITQSVHREYIQPLMNSGVVLSLDDINYDTQSTENLDSIINSSNLAYVIYTSGTSGKPKGVMVEHRNAVHLSFAQTEAFKAKTCKRALQFASYVFDASVSEIFVSLLNGHELYIASQEQRQDPEKVSQLIQENRIELATLPPVFLAQLEAQDLTALKVLVTAGETPTLEVMERFSKQCYMINAYGPTEATVCASAHHFEPGDRPNNIGKPIPNAQLYVLDKQRNPVPIGAPGELYIGGEGITRGYLNKPELTSDTFINNPFAGSSLLYKTGDLVRWTPNGEIEYLGRNDFQVKIRGYRIELGEVEQVLLSLPEVGQCAVIDVKRGSQKSLAAYVVAESQRTTDSQPLAEKLGALLPEYMVPSSFTFLDKLPLTINGKLDRKALPEIQNEESETYSAPVNETELLLSEIWQALLGVEKIGTGDHFFRIGGDSIIAIQLVSRLRKRGVNLQVSDIFDAPTIKELARKIQDNNGKAVQINAEQGCLEGRFDLLPIQQWFFDQEYAQPNHWNQAFMISLPEIVKEKDLQEVLAVLVRQHDILGCRFIREKGKVVQEYAGDLAVIPQLKVLDCSQLDEQELFNLLTQWQSELDIFQGPLWQAAYLKNAEAGEYRLFFAFHHLIIDTVSWRILAEDVKNLLADDTKQMISEKALPKKTSSYRQWVEANRRYAENNQQEIPYWQSIASSQVDYYHIQETNRTSFSLPLEETRQLLSECNAGYQTEINDLLLSALSYGLYSCFKQPIHSVCLEGHGRENIDPSLDISRTLGWFTSVYPVQLEVADTIEDTIIQTKESLRKIPNKGVGFGALRSSGHLQGTVLPPISFNYLGQLNDEGAAKKEGSLWQIIMEGCGLSSSPENESHTILAINSVVQNGQLYISLEGKLSRDQINQFEEAYLAALRNIISQAQSAVDKGGFKTPSDFPVANLTLPRLRNLKEKYNIENLFEANSLQQGFVYQYLSQPDGDAYRVQVLLDYAYELDINVYQKAWYFASLRFPALRTAFDWDGDILQVVSSEASIGETNFSFFDISHLPENERETEIDRLRLEDRKYAFDLSLPGLIRFQIVRQKAGLYTVLKSDHHSIGDGWSGPILWETVHNYYNLLLKGETPEVIPETAYQGAQKYYFENRAVMERYWLGEKERWQQANDLNSLLSERVDLSQRKHIDNQTEKALVIDGESYKQLKALCLEKGLTINVVMQFAWHKLIQSHSQDAQTIVGTTVSGRDIPVEGIENSVGLYINTLPLTVDWEPQDTCIEIMQAIQKDIAALNTYSGMPLAGLQKTGEALFHSLFVFENYPVPVNQNVDDEPKFVTGSKPEFRPIEKCTHFRGIVEKTDYPLTALAYEGQGEAVLRLKYGQNYLTEEKAEALLGEIEHILHSVCESPEAIHNKVSLYSDDINSSYQWQWNRVEECYPETTLISGIEHYAQTTPDQIAVITSHKQTSYDELNQQRLSIAASLHQDAPEKGELVAVLCEKGELQAAACLGIMTAGCAYLPLNVAWPAGRIHNVLKAGGVKHVLVSSPMLSTIEGEAWLVDYSISVVEDVVNQPADSELIKCLPVISPQDIAYVIFTSGSTGTPKGVVISHEGAMNTNEAVNQRFKVTEEDRVLALSDLSFDLSVYDIFGILNVGATVVFPEQEKILDPSHWLAMVKEYEITLWNTVPQLVQLLVQEAQSSEQTIQPLRVVMMSGDWIPLSLPNQIRSCIDEDAVVMSLGGATEGSIWSIWYSIEEVKPGWPSIPYGTAMPNQQMWVLDDSGNPTPFGVTGEIHIGGLGVAKGYFNNKEKTQAQFFTHPELGHLYKTGDLGAWKEEGYIEFRGRKDFQVKIRGYRIELGEIEKTLLALPEVKQAVVVDMEQQGNKYLSAYVVMQPDQTMDENYLRGALESSLPEYMIPSAFTSINTLPLTANGKLDRKGLPEPDFSFSDQYIAPESDMEIKLCDIWREVLGLTQVGTQDNFFMLGGNSVLLIRLNRLIKERLGIDIPLMELFELKSVSAIVNFVSSSDSTYKSKVLHCLRKAEVGAPILICLPYAGGEGMAFDELSKQITEEISVYSLSYTREFDYQNLEEATKVLEKYVEACVNDIALVADGPVVLYGHSAGARVSLLIARRLQKRDIEVQTMCLGGSLIPDHVAQDLEAFNVEEQFSIIESVNEQVIRSGLSAGEGSALSEQELAELLPKFRRDAFFGHWCFGKFVEEAYPEKLNIPLYNFVAKDDPFTEGYEQRWSNWNTVATQCELAVLESGGHYFVSESAKEVAKQIDHIIKSVCSQVGA